MQANFLNIHARTLSHIQSRHRKCKRVAINNQNSRQVRVTRCRRSCLQDNIPTFRLHTRTRDIS